MNGRWVLWLGVALITAGCAAKKQSTATEYFDQATMNFRDGILTLAIDQYRELLDQHPFSEYSEEAELKIAQAQYLAGNYPEAVVALTDCQRRHPTSPHLPLVGYYLGMCYVKQMGTIDRDQSAARSAHTYFLTLAQQYPESPFAELAREELARCREELAEHELYVANFYAKQGNTAAAEMRLLTLADQYGETNAAADGLLKLATLYRRDDRDMDAALAYKALTRLHPAGPQASAARRALEKLSNGDPPAPTADPLELLLALHGRQRDGGSLQALVSDRELLSAGGTLLGTTTPATVVPPADPFGTASPY